MASARVPVIAAFDVVMGRPFRSSGCFIPTHRRSTLWPAGRGESFPDKPEEASMARIAVVTGSDSGIGKATAVALARAGYDVGITWHEDKDGAEDTAREVERAGRRAEVRHL